MWLVSKNICVGR